jgi:hypothetical protein
MNSIMILYHGSSEIVSRPEYGKGRIDNDYGRGFYCTESEEMAKEWSTRSGTEGYVNRYSLDASGLETVDLNSDSYTVLNWLAVLLENRVFDPRGDSSYAREYIIENYGVDLSGADLVRGYRADDSYFAFARDFLDNVISVRRLSEAMRLGKLGEQVMVRSERAFSRLVFEGCESVNVEAYGQLRARRDHDARMAYSEIRRIPPSKDDVYIADIIRGLK